MAKKTNTIPAAKIKMPLADFLQFTTRVTMPGTLTIADETKRKRADLFPEFEGIVKDGKIKVIMANKTGNVYGQLVFNCEVLQPGKVWCGYTGKLAEYAASMKSDGDVVVEFDKTIVMKTADVTVNMRNISEEVLQYTAPARAINEKFDTSSDKWIYHGPNGDKPIDAKFRANIADLKPIVNDGSLMDQVYYPFIMVLEDEKSVIVVQAKNEYDSIERRIAPIDSNGVEFSTDYQVGIDSVLLNLAGEITVRAGNKTPMVVISETEKCKMHVFIANRIIDPEAQITENMFVEMDGVDTTPTPTTVVEEQNTGENDDFI